MSAGYRLSTGPLAVVAVVASSFVLCHRSVSEFEETSERMNEGTNDRSNEGDE